MQSLSKEYQLERTPGEQKGNITNAPNNMKGITNAANEMGVSNAAFEMGRRGLEPKKVGANLVEVELQPVNAAFPGPWRSGRAKEASATTL